MQRTLTFLLIGALCASVVSADLRPQLQGPKKPERTRRFVKEIPAPDDVAQPPQDADRTASGIVSRVLEPGRSEEHPRRNDVVTLRYTGWTTDGAMFDTTEDKNRPREVRVGGLIDGLVEGLQLMTVGESRRFWIPTGQAYDGADGRPQGMLVFDVTLERIERGPEPPGHLTVPADATVADSGLAWKTVQAGEGTSPGPEDTVLVHYESWTEDGLLLESTRTAGEPRDFTVSLTIPAFQESFAAMKRGERRLIWAPPEATTLRGRPVHEGTILFDIELIDYIAEPTPPVSVSAIPDDATVTSTGLAYRVLTEGRGEENPGSGDTVEVIYAGWTRDGQRFDSSYDHGRAGKFKLDSSMPIGWNQALYGMVEGERRLLWIPEDLAYGGRDDRPRGMLVFDVELVKIHP